MNQVSTFRLYVLRATYLLMFVGLAYYYWPGIIRHGELSVSQSAVRSILGAVSLLALLGIRYPLQMLPLMLFELVWKSIWLIAMGLPLWLGNQVDAEVHESIKACLMGVILFPIVIPWPYVFASYVKRRGDRWALEPRA
ncbi:MAG TPA: hypothetical protein VFA20_28180 [Myxococcaceae bacterium]|nr:hypothetical protein [Myxococcaceae bacterium]